MTTEERLRASCIKDGFASRKRSGLGLALVILASLLVWAAVIFVLKGCIPGVIPPIWG